MYIMYFALEFNVVQFFWPPRGPSGQKMLFKKGTFLQFFPFLGLTSNAIFSVILPCRMLFCTILENYKGKSFQKWFWIMSHLFGSGHKMYFFKTIFDVFVSFLAQIFSVICLYYFVRWWGPEGPPNALRRS